MREYFSGGITMTVTDGCFRLSTDSMVLADFCRLPRGAAVCDLGSGCGALGLLLLRDHPDMRVTGLEILPDAAAQARKNIDANHLSEHFSVITGDLREHRALLPASAFDAVVSNPPYLTAAEMGQLQPEVAQEPAMALAAGEDGLVFYRALAEHYQRALRPGGALALEIGWQQREAVTALLEANGWVGIACRKDYGGNDRAVTARKPCK